MKTSAPNLSGRFLCILVAVSFLSLVTNTALPALHGKLHAVKGGGGHAAPTLCAEPHAEHGDHHDHGHPPDEHEAPQHADDDHSANCHLCRVLAQFSADTVYFPIDFTDRPAGADHVLADQTILAATLVLTDPSRGPPRTLPKLG